MAGFASQAALRGHYEDLIDEAENDITEKLSSAVSWFKQVVVGLNLHSSFRSLAVVSEATLCTFYDTL